MKQDCSTCRFSTPVPNGPETSVECRRYAPTPQLVDGTIIPRCDWPRVGRTDWCGDYKPRVTR